MSTTTVVQIQELQQQLSGTCFEYQIYNQAQPIVYDSGTDTVRKCFTSGATTQTVGCIATLNNENVVVDDNQFLDGFDDDVFSVVKQSTGKLVLVTQAQTYQGDLIGNDSGDLMILRLDTDGTIDGTFTKVTFFKDNPVYLRLQSTDKIIVFGDFTFQGIYNGIMRLNVNGGFDGSFQVSNGFIGGYPWDVLVLPNDKMIVVGVFTDYYAYGFSPSGLGNIIGLRADGSAESTVGEFDYPYPMADSIVKQVRRLNNGNLIFVGAFQIFAGGFRRGIAQTDSTGTFIAGFGNFQAGFTSNVMAVDPITNDIFVQGAWSTYSGITVPKFVKLSSGGTLNATFNAALTAATSFSTNPNNEAFKINNAGNLVAAGGFNNFNGHAVTRYAEINTTTAALVNDNADFNSAVYGVLPDGDNVICWGDFTSTTSAEAANGLFQIPLGANSAATLLNIYNNLFEFNAIDGMVYSILGDSVYATYTTDNSFVTVPVIDDIPSYLLITTSGETSPPIITFTARPQALTPCYNPVVFNFSAETNTEPAFRYKVAVYDANTNDLIDRWNIAPQLDGTGYLDMAKTLQNFMSFSFNQYSAGFTDALNSYKNIYVTLGAEYQVAFPFVSASEQLTGIFSGGTELQGDGLTPLTYVVGDQIVIEANVTGTSLTGLWTVNEITGGFSFVINLTYRDAFSAATGTTNYANGARNVFPDTDIVQGLTVFNGARSWGDFINWIGDDYTMGNVTSDDKKFLTNLPANFYVTPSQDLFLNYFNQDTVQPLRIFWLANTGQYGVLSAVTGTTLGKVVQHALGPNQLGITGTTEWYEFNLLDGNDANVSERIRVFIDNRCKIEDYEVLFMDRMGSFASYAFQLRSKEFGGIDRNTYKKAVQYTLAEDSYANAYDITDKGTRIFNVAVTKSFELQTNWMTDEMSVYFEELLSSPVTFLKVNGLYYSCTVQDKDYEVQRQRNKNLIRKTIVVMMANDNNINI